MMYANEGRKEGRATEVVFRLAMFAALVKIQEILIALRKIRIRIKIRIRKLSQKLLMANVWKGVGIVKKNLENSHWPSVLLLLGSSVRPKQAINLWLQYAKAYKMTW